MALKRKRHQPPANLEPQPFPEILQHADRQREAGLYDLLGSEDVEERIAAANCILRSLFENGDGNGNPCSETILTRHLEHRLFRGLSSGRNASRPGFSLVITEILSRLYGDTDTLADQHYTGLPFEKVLNIFKDKTKSGGNVSGQEERDSAFGRLFGLECFVRSNTLFQASERWQPVLDMLMELATQKVWLRPACGLVVADAIKQMDQEEATGTLKRFADAGLGRTPEGVALWLVALSRFPEIHVKPWTHHPLATQSLGHLGQVLRESFKNTPEEDAEGQVGLKQANWTAQSHFVWDHIIAHYKRPEVGVEDFQEFCGRVIDDALFSKKATDGQKFKGFNVFLKLLHSFADLPAKLGCLFGKNFMACLMNQAAKEDRFLHRAAVKALKALEDVVRSHPTSLPTILSGMIGENGAYSFDSRTNTKTVDKLLQHVNTRTEEECLAIVRQPLVKLGKLPKPQGQAIVRSYIDYLAKLLNSSGGDSTEGHETGAALAELATIAYSQPRNIPTELLTDSIKENCRLRLETAISKLIRRSKDFTTFCNAVLSIDSAAIDMAPEIRTAVDDALARMKKLMKRKTKTEGEKTSALSLAMLHAVSILRLYNEDPDAMETLQDLEQIAERSKKGRKDEDDEGSTEILVEVLLSMVSRPSKLMREVSQQIFGAFTSQMTTEALELLTGPLTTSESTKGQKELFDTAEDGDEIVDGSDEEEDAVEEMQGIELNSDGEIDSDVEFVDLKADGTEADSDEDDSDADDDDDEDEDSDKKQGPMDIDDFDKLVGDILKSHRLDKDADAASSDDDQDMSDSEMLAMDDKLGEVFKQQAKSKPDSKQQKRDAKAAVVNLKNRILDLLEIFIKNEPLNPLAFSVLVPLLSLMRTTGVKPLASRASAIVVDYQKRMKKARNNKEVKQSGLTADVIFPYLAEVHEEARQGGDSHEYSKTASAASLLLAVTMHVLDKSSEEKVNDLYSQTFAAKKGLQLAFFADWENWRKNRA
ncbi:DNA polymerase phi-domain-containing protein [Emericellopsis atlantica]|uniref:DNA polymerase phi-domain-containing protein n=1 Tax=Emericellopsis atlantica TaxID=2614577 RepID=A0A9P7ZUP5_9HYPO|nr:DNA polymerase phi-domain-containing protein [Emericellopsis atlantica]KAG9257988.1 DNA polymerase phi-domain-containing protein [Emericellopsis atlantica]